MKFVVYVKNLMLNVKLMVFLILNICNKNAHLFQNKSHLFRALKTQMTLVQTLSDNNQTKLDNNEQQIEQVSLFVCLFFSSKIFVLVSNRNWITSSTINHTTTGENISLRYSNRISIFERIFDRKLMNEKKC